MSHALPVSATSGDPALPALPLGELIAETFWVTADGRLVNEVQRALRLSGSLDPGRPKPPVLAQFVGSATTRGAFVRPLAGVLDRLIKEAVERQLEFAVTFMATILLDLVADVGFGAATVSVSELRISRSDSPPQADASMVLSGGAVTGIVLPPVSDAADPG
jgi:hypothetical protein